MENNILIIYHLNYTKVIKTGGVKYHIEILNGIKNLTKFIYFLESKYIFKISLINYLLNNIYLCNKLKNIMKNKNFKKYYLILDYTNRFTHILPSIIFKIFKHSYIIINVQAIYFSYRKNKLKNIIDLIISKIFLKKADLIITAGENLKNIIKEQWNINKPQFEIISPAIREIFINNYKTVSKPENNIWNLIFVGRFHPIKGLEYLVEAINTLKNESLILHIYAEIDGSKYCKKIINMIEKYQLIDKIKLHGAIYNEDELISKYLMSQIFILSSLWDTYPTVLLEAKCVGLPIIATFVGDVPYIIENNIDGIIVKPENTNSLIESIKYLIYNPNIWENMSKNSFKNSFKFRKKTWKEVSEKFNNCLLKLI